MATGSRGVASLTGVVAAAHPLAAQAGASILREGGNAFDAAAATAAALGVVEPYMSGLAGTGMATCYDTTTGRVLTLDFVPRVPLGLPDGDLSPLVSGGGGAVTATAPGCLRGWESLVIDQGRMSLADVLEPAIRLAADGYALTEFAAAEITTTLDEMAAQGSAQLPTIRAHYAAGRDEVRPGEVLRQPALAATMQTIADEGVDSFYQGPIGALILEVIQRHGGWVTADDLATFRPRWQEPLSVDYRDLQAWSLPPPSEAFQFLMTMRLLDGVDVTRYMPDGVDHLDTVFRAARLAAIERVGIFNPSPADLADVLGDANIGELRDRLRSTAVIDGPTERGWPWPGEDVVEAMPEQHTTSLSVADREGNVVCITQSLGSVFGCRVLVEDLGVCLNNFLKWGAVHPDSPLALRAGGPLARPMAPSILTRAGKPVLSVGSPGSYGIPQHQAQVVVQHVDFGRPIQAAVEAPRGRLTDGRALLVEGRMRRDVVDGLRQRGHDVVAGPDWTRKVGGVQAVAIDQQRGVLHGACDPRRDGYVASA